MMESWEELQCHMIAAPVHPRPSTVVGIFSVLSERGWHSELSVALTVKSHCGLGCELHSELAATGYTRGPFPKGS